ncbi:MAG TPA: response regulator transcription factor [Ktedonosporobacter sp.]|nr:response regulator transcription factor [Ktedonosporobacter sp.]
MAQRIRVLIVDDQTLVREGLRKLLEFESDLEVLEPVANGQAALAAVERLTAEGAPPAVILMDILMPQMDGITATTMLKARWPEAHIVMLTTFGDTRLISSGLRAGALGYVLKDATAEELVQTIHAASRGQTLLQPAVASKVFSSLPPSPAGSVTAATEAYFDGTGDVESLTEREREILTLVVRGASNRQIGERLYLQEGTVKNHITNILSKLRVRDRTQAALKARDLGLGSG